MIYSVALMWGPHDESSEQSQNVIVHALRTMRINGPTRAGAREALRMHNHVHDHGQSL
jgi:hypothetical protein